MKVVGRQAFLSMIAVFATTLPTTVTTTIPAFAMAAPTPFITGENAAG